MQSISRFFSVLTYLAMAYAGFTALGTSMYLLPVEEYAHFGWMILLFSFVGFLAAIVFNILKMKWVSFFILAGTGLARVYVSFLLIVYAELEMTAFYNHHLPALLVVAFALFSTIFYKLHLREEQGITFRKTEKDRELMEEKQALEEIEEGEAEEADEAEE